jgi:hypothetical protein
MNNRIKRQLLNKAKRMSPIDTGNLRFNAIKGMKWNNPNEFTIYYDSTEANYIEYLEESTFAGRSKTKKNRHKDFIKRTAIELKKDLEYAFSNGAKGFKGRQYNKPYNTRDQETLMRRDARNRDSLDYWKMNREEYENAKTRSFEITI